MSDAATSTKSVKKTSKAKSQVAFTHPPYKNMIIAAIKSLKERNGSSRQAILKYITSHYQVGDEKKAGSRLRIALRRTVAAGHVKQIKGSGALGSFRLAKDDTTPAKKTKTAKSGKSVAKKASKPKKPAAKKASKPKKPSSKKTHKKPSVKKAAKKPAAKKVSKKPAVKKVAKKPAAKKAK